MDVVAGTAEVDLTPYDRWDTFPPDQGRIELRSNTDLTPAVQGEYRVVLSFTPGNGYLRSWAIPAYARNGIPFVPRRDENESPGDPVATRDAAAAAGLPEPGACTLWAGDLLLEVRNLRTTEPMADPRGLYTHLVAMGLSDRVLETMVFVLSLDESELELSRNEVRASDLLDYIRAYAELPGWDLRCALAYVLQDQGSPELADLRQDVLRAPLGRALSIRHIAQATALAWLRGDIALNQRYLDDPDLLVQEMRAWLREHGTQP